MAKVEGRRPSSGRPQRGQAGRASVFTADEKKLKTVWQAGQ